MPHIELEKHLPGVTGLLEFRKDTGDLLRELTQVLLKGHSTLSEGERELIATIVSHRNDCTYCKTSHTAVANAYLGESKTSEMVKEDIETAPISEKMKALLQIAALVQVSGKKVDEPAVQRAKNAGATDLEIHDTVMIAALFSFYNRYVDGLATIAPQDPIYYTDMAKRLAENGYHRPTKGYDSNKIPT